MRGGLALKGLKTEFNENKRGKLKIYLGYAAGVGKTYAMLADAHEIQKNNINLVAGYIEPHMRIDTIELLEGLKTIPPLKIDYKGIVLNEADIDTILKISPDLVLIDELAHTNAKGSRHTKRYQDIEELLQAGIDVWTTLNIQHLESLNDIIESITGIHVRERIPDSVFDGADQIEVVDIEPADLIERLNKGKVYPEGQIERALQNFFAKEKLVSLREIALRRTADQVNRIALQDESLKIKSMYTNEHILVCVSPSPTNAKVVRTAARMADAFHGKFTAISVIESNVEDNKALFENMRLAEQLGAQLVTIQGEDIPFQIADYALESHVSKIVMGKSLKKNKWFKKNYADKLTNLAANIDIYIIPDNEISQMKYPKFGIPQIKISALDMLKSIAILLICTILGWLIYDNKLGTVNIITVYILGVLINAVLTKGRLYSAVSSILSVIIYNFLFTEPRFSLETYDSGYPVTFIIMLSAALLTSTLTRQIKYQASQSNKKAYRTELLLETNRKLQQAQNKKEIIRETAEQLIKLFGGHVIFYINKNDKLTEPIFFSNGNTENCKTDYIGIEERAVAEWVLKNNKHAGASTNTLSASKCLYLAVRGNKSVLGVVGIAIEKQNRMEIFEKNILIAILGECGLALEKEEFYENQKHISLKMEQEQTKAKLLNAISYDLKTPLTNIIQKINDLGEMSPMNKSQFDTDYKEIYDDAIWMENLLDNLVLLNQIEQNKIKLEKSMHKIEELVKEALLKVNRESIEHQIEVKIKDSDLQANLDAKLITQVIVNIVDNAIKFTQNGSKIIIFAEQHKNAVKIEISDDGSGVSNPDKLKIFDMMFMTEEKHEEERRGFGLGLYLCKVIVSAHKGSIYIKDNIPNGTILGFTLPNKNTNER